VEGTPKKIFSRRRIGARATENYRPETGKFPPPSTKIQKIPVPKIPQNKPRTNFKEVSISLVLQAFTAGLQTATVL